MVYPMWSLCSIVVDQFAGALQQDRVERSYSRRTLKRLVLFRLEKHGKQDVIKSNYNQTAVSNFVASVQLDLHRTGRAVSFAAVLNRVCEQLGVDKYSDLGLGPPRQLPRLRRLSELESRLVIYVTTYVANRYYCSTLCIQTNMMCSLLHTL